MPKPSQKISLWPPTGSDVKPIDDALWGVLENKTNTISH